MAANRFNKMEGDLPHSIMEANKTDTDVLQEIRFCKHRLPVQFTAAWVKSHQERCDTREARLNRVADCLALLQYSKRATEQVKLP